MKRGNKMTRCPSCNNEMNYVEQHSQWYCYTCHRYQQAAPAHNQAPPAPPPAQGQQQYQQPPAQDQQQYQQAPAQYQQPPPVRGKSKSTMILLAVFAVIIVVILAAAFIFMSTGDDNGGGKTKTMTYDDLENNYDSYTMGFKSLSPGDTVKIEEKLVYIASEYDDWEDETVTYIWLESAHKGETEDDWREYDDWDEDYYYYDSDFTFQSDLTSTYSAGDDVVITLHIIKIEFYGYTREFFDELWDGKQITYNLPTSCMKKA